MHPALINMKRNTIYKCIANTDDGFANCDFIKVVSYNSSYVEFYVLDKQKEQISRYTYTRPLYFIERYFILCEEINIYDELERVLLSC